MDGLSGALTTAGLALFAKIVYDEWTRIRDRRAVASALAGEVAAYIQMLHPKQTAKNFRAIKDLDPAIRKKRLAAFPTLPTGHPVFDKVAEKVGRLPPQEASDVSAFYNIVTGFRIHASKLSSPEFAETDDLYQFNAMDFLATVMDQASSAQNLVQRLDWIASQSIWSMLLIGSTAPSDLPDALPRRQTFNLIPSQQEPPAPPAKPAPPPPQ